MKGKNNLSRLDFLRISAIGAGALILPASVVSAKEKKSVKKSNVVRLAYIGLGSQAMSLRDGFINMDNIKIVAGSDVYGVKRSRFKKRVEKHYAEKGQPTNVDLYSDYKELLKRDDIDAVVIATPDHWHAAIAIAACDAKKDVYLEKPLTFTIHEGQELCKAVRRNNVILQVGSQQRSGSEFIHATNLVREGVLGKITKVLVHVGEKPAPYDRPKQEVPADLDWNTWLGPLPETIHYNECLAPVITLVPEKNENDWAAWRYYKETGGGFTTDWGAHMFDIVQWGLGKDGSGPTTIIPPGKNGKDCLTFIYDNGIEVSHYAFKGPEYRGVRFIGENGWIEVSRDQFECSNPEWAWAKQAEEKDLPYESRVPHLSAFINSVLTRVDPNAPVEVGHSTCSMCLLANIAYELDRPLTWNPITQKFMNDPEAMKYLHYEYRKGFTL